MVKCGEFVCRRQQEFVKWCNAQVHTDSPGIGHKEVLFLFLKGGLALHFIGNELTGLSLGPGLPCILYL